MTFPVWMLLAFALWTVSLLLFTIGIYRWTRILTGRVEIKNFRADNAQGDNWYSRAMRAHANCIENLPVFGAIVFALYASNLSGGLINVLATIVVLARIGQSIIHVAIVQTNTVAFIRFIFFFTQLICFVGLAAIVIKHAL